VFEDIEEASSNDTQRRNVFLDSFNNLTLNLTSATETAGGIEDEVVKARKQHSECRDEEKVALDAKTKCDSELAVLLLAKDAAFEELTGITGRLKGLICHSDVVAKLQQKVDTAVPYADAGRKYITAEEAYNTKKEECDLKTQKYTDARAECAEKQKVLEQCTCIQGFHATDSCAAYTAGYTTKKEDYNIFLTSLADSVAKRKFEWKHLNRVACTLRALARHEVSNHESLTKEINGCQAKTFVNSVLDIALTPAPPKGECPSVPDLPCAGAYLKKEYSNLPEGCPAHDCVPCVPDDH